MILSLIVAVSSNNVIGKENKLPWHLPNDLKYFKNTTWAMPIIMGRKTYESIGKPLPGRTNIVISRNTEWNADGTFSVQTLEQAIELSNQLQVKELFIIGGAEIFNTSLPLAKRIYLTRIHQDFDGDVFFPNVNEENWKMISNRDCQPDEKNAFAHSFQVWERK